MTARPPEPTRPARRGLVVALDGPASSGKSSVGAAAATRLGYRFCDTGLLYRAVTWLALRRGVSPEDAAALVALVPEVRLLDVGDGRLAHVAVDGVDETVEVHGPEVDLAVSAVSRAPELRATLLERQRAIADGGRIIMAGRDIGTVILPDADVKLFLDASIEERARRRAEERGEAPGSPAAAETLVELRRRDNLDSSRPVAPLRAAEDAVVIRTDGNAFETTVELVVTAIRDRERAAAHHATSAPRPRRARAKPTSIVSQINWFRWLSGGVLRLLARSSLRLTFEGDPSAVAPPGALIVAGNHASSADPVLIGAFLNARLGRCVNWLGKRELVEMPVIGPFMRMVPIHPVDREAADLDAFRTAIRILDSGNILAIFPEGTRSRDGALKPVREGAGVLALHSGAPVMPVAVIDSDLAWPKGRLVPHFRRPVTVRWGRPFRVTDELPEIASMPRREANAAATRLIMTRIAELLPPRQRGVYAADVAAAQPNEEHASPAPSRAPG
ncbi:MAG TPA: (d)CMP kinase [Candidatus Limnocylindrales bacterium]|nr:(d)CMP kinase [Candidatus Limnocylindrales bacterium]